jgi:hypothetical protein
MFEQLSLEKRALRILAMPVLDEGKSRAEEVFRKNWLAETPDGRARLKNAINRYTLLCAQLAVLDDPGRPRLMWSCNLPHDWFGVHWPGTGWGIDNPDNFYRYFFVDGTSSYEIYGQRNGRGPVQQTYLLYSSIPGTTVQDIEGASVISSLSDEDIRFCADGSFKITISREPASPEENHLQSRPDARIVFIRDTLGDWSREFPHRLRVIRVAGALAPPSPTDTEVAEQAATLLRTIVPYWLKFWQTLVYDHPPNVVPKPVGRSGRWGCLTNAWFKLRADECLLVTADSLDAGYFAAQIADPWSITPNYDRHSCGLNSKQARPNPDGTYTFVVSPKDPGVWNWIDTNELRLGLLLLRWQALTQGSRPLESAIYETRVVKTQDLRKYVPDEAAWVTTAQRQQQLAERATFYARRLAN